MVFGPLSNKKPVNRIFAIFVPFSVTASGRPAAALAPTLGLHLAGLRRRVAVLGRVTGLLVGIETRKSCRFRDGRRLRQTRRSFAASRTMVEINAAKRERD